MDDNKHYQVVISNQLNTDQDKNQVIKKLAILFKTDEDKAARLLAKTETIVKDNLDQATANKYLTAIQKTGASCMVIDKIADDALPDIVEPVKPDTSGFVREDKIKPASKPEQDAVLRMVEKAEKEEADTKAKLSQYTNIKQELHCPECGTIRSSEDAICVQCGYDPAPPKDNSRIKKITISAIITMIIIGLVAVLGMPFYEQFTTKRKIENGLLLAFETRNKITEFIQRTNFWPNQNIDAGLSKNISNDVIASLVITDNAEFTVTVHPHIINQVNQTIIFKPNMLKGKIVWNCTGGTLNEKYRPDICMMAQP